MMAGSGSGYAYPQQHSANIIDALVAYGSHGGALYAAYRHQDNPLLLTHVRWQSETGDAIEASRGPDEEMALVQEEREAWAQIAIRSTTLRPETVGPQAPWLLVPIDPREAYQLGERALQARQASRPAGGGYSSIRGSGGAMRGGYGVSASPVGSSQIPSSAPGQHRGGSSSMDFGSSRGGDLFHSYPSRPDSSQTTGAWNRDTLSHAVQQEIITVVCIEVEMPNLVADPSQDFTRDFARDVATNFNRAARTIPQTRETRGWMHGSRMVLAALMALGTGSRPASSAENDHAAATLADALARRTLPYVRLRFADMNEWANGVALPE